MSKAAQIIAEMRAKDAEHAAFNARSQVQVSRYVRKGVSVKSHKRTPPGQQDGWPGLQELGL